MLRGGVTLVVGAAMVPTDVESSTDVMAEAGGSLPKPNVEVSTKGDINESSASCSTTFLKGVPW